MTVLRGDAARRLMARARARHVEHPSGRPDQIWTASTAVEDGPDSTSLVRGFVRDQLRRYDMGDRSADSTLVVSELVANAIAHGRAPVVLSLSRLRHGTLSVEVSDAAPPTPMLQAALDRHRAEGVHHSQARPALVEAESGRGLEIVGLLSSSWGVREDADGKSVWALLEQDIA